MSVSKPYCFKENLKADDEVDRGSAERSWARRGWEGKRCGKWMNGGSEKSVRILSKPLSKLTFISKDCLESKLNSVADLGYPSVSGACRQDPHRPEASLVYEILNVKERTGDTSVCELGQVEDEAPFTQG